MRNARKLVLVYKCGQVDQVDVIVFEYLEMQGKISGNKKQILH